MGDKGARFVFGGHQGRDSEMGTAIPVRGKGTSKPARDVLIRGKAELLSGMDIDREIDIAVRPGGRRFAFWEE